MSRELNRALLDQILQKAWKNHYKDFHEEGVPFIENLINDKLAVKRNDKIYVDRIFIHKNFENSLYHLDEPLMIFYGIILKADVRSYLKSDICLIRHSTNANLECETISNQAIKELGVFDE